MNLLNVSRHSQELLQNKEMDQCCLTDAMRRQRLDQLSEDIIALCGRIRGPQYKYTLNFAEQCQKPDPWDPTSTAPFKIRIGLQLERHHRECYEKSCCEPQILYSVSEHITCQRKTALPLSTDQKMDLAEEMRSILEKRAKKNKASRSGFGQDLTNQDQPYEETDALFLPFSSPIPWWKLKFSGRKTPSGTYTVSSTSDVPTT